MTRARSSLRFLAAALLGLGIARPASADILIGVAGPLTGNYATYGEQLRKGAEVAIEQINAQGGVLGQKLAFKYGDDACDPKQAVAVANELIASEVAVVIGHHCSGSSIPASGVYNEAGIVMITPGSTNPQLTEQGFDNVFRLCGRDDNQGGTAAAYLAHAFKGKKIAIAHDRQAYGMGLAEATRAALGKLGIQPVLFDTVSPGQRDYSALITKLKVAGADVLYYGGYHSELALILQQARGQNLNLVGMGGDSLMSQEFWSIAGAAANETRMTFAPDAARDPKNAPLLEAFKAKGYKPESFVVYAYSALQVWKAAVEKAGTLDGEAVIKALREVQADTMIGHVSFDAKGDVKGPAYVVYRWKDGAYDYADDAPPAAAAQ